MPTMVQSLLVIGISVFAVWQRNIIVYVAAFLMLIFVGVEIADETLTLGLPVLLFGVYMLYHTATCMMGGGR